MLWRILWKAEALLLAVLVGCSAAQSGIRVDTGAAGETLIYIPRAATVEPVQVAPEQVTEAIRKLAREVRLTGSPRQTVERLFQLDALYGDYLYLRRERKIVPLESSGMPLEGALTEEEQNLVSRYKAWCRSAHGFEGDCLGGALVGGKYLDMQGRYMLAMALSKSPVLEEFEKALGEMVSMRAVLQAAIGTVVTLLVLLALPEPITKFVAAWATAALVLWVGAKTLYNLITGWFQLMEEVKSASHLRGDPRGGREVRQAVLARGGASVRHDGHGAADAHGEGVRAAGGDAARFGAGVDAGGGPRRPAVVRGGRGGVRGGDGRGLQRGAGTGRGGDGGARWARRPHGEAPHRDHREQEVHLARWPVDPPVRGAFRQGGNAAEGP